MAATAAILAILDAALRGPQIGSVARRPPRLTEISVSYVALTCRCAIGLVFLVAVLGKLRGAGSFTTFRDSVRELAAVRGRAADLLAAGVVVTEACVAVLLAVPATVSAGMVLAGVDLLGFSLAIGRALRTGVRAPCRCFGASSAPLGRPHLIRNGALLAVVVAGLAAGTGQSSGVRPAGALLALFVAGVTAVVMVFFEDIASLFVP